MDEPSKPRTPPAAGKRAPAYRGSVAPARRRPRGIRNNNPGNIRYTGRKWLGASSPPSDGEFCRFYSPLYGLRALFKVLLAYRRRGLKTLSAIIGTWAPPEENNTQAYVEHALKLSGLTLTQEIDVHNPRDALRIARAIVVHENGPGPEGQPHWYPHELYMQAHEKAMLIEGFHPKGG